MKDFESDPKVGAKIPEDLLEIIKKVIVGKSRGRFHKIVQIKDKKCW